MGTLSTHVLDTSVGRAAKGVAVVLEQGGVRIGERAGAGHDAEFSAREQAQVERDDAEVMAALADGNREYERRFDRVFLIRAARRSSSEILAELRRRLDNDDDTERAETAAALREIALLRLKDVM